MASLTINGLEDRVLERLREQARQRNLSLDALVRQILARSVGLEPEPPAYSDLNHLAGSWTAKDAAEFLESTRPFREIDEGHWRRGTGRS